MKKTLLLILYATVLSSCGTTYYQMYDVGYASQPIERPELTVSYDLWAKGGLMSFIITNNTDKILTVQWDKSFFILNGLSVPYYNNTEYTEGEGAKVVRGNVVYGNSSSFTKKQERTIMVAPGASLPFVTYQIQTKYLRLEALNPSPRKKSISRSDYSLPDSPIRFSNFITYSIEGDHETKTIKHDFYVKSVSNWHSSDFANDDVWSRPGEPVTQRRYYEAGPMRFYVEYF